MLLVTDFTARVLFQATHHDAIQTVEGRIEMFSYGKPVGSVSNSAEVLDETLLLSPSCLSDVNFSVCLINLD